MNLKFLRGCGLCIGRITRISRVGPWRYSPLEMLYTHISEPVLPTVTGSAWWPASRPRFSTKNFSRQEFQQFVDRVFKGCHHLNIPFGLAICSSPCKFQLHHITDSYRANNLNQLLVCSPPAVHCRYTELLNLGHGFWQTGRSSFVLLLLSSGGYEVVISTSSYRSI